MLPVVYLVIAAAVCGSGASAQEPLAAPAPAGAASASKQDMGYAMGFRIGQQILAEQQEIGSPVDQMGLAAGLADAVSGKKPMLDEQQFRAAMASLEVAMRRQQAKMAERMQAAAKTNLTVGGEYLKKKAAEPNVKALPSGLLYEVLKQGEGPQPTLDDVVVAHYSGKHIDGKEFDGTDPAAEPAEFPLRGVVPGWQEALPLMKAGSTWRIHLPAALAYGEEGSPPAIEPNEVLVFDIELIGTKPAPKR